MTFMFDRLADDSKRVIERAMREALQLGHNRIRPEHIFLALIHDDDSLVLEALGGDRAALKREIIEALWRRRDAATPSFDRGGELSSGWTELRAKTFEIAITPSTKPGDANEVREAVRRRLGPALQAIIDQLARQLRRPR
jgi:ATP-dependent Clp protease ATP-binding subunit ClpA